MYKWISFKKSVFQMSSVTWRRSRAAKFGNHRPHVSLCVRGGEIGAELHCQGHLCSPLWSPSHNTPPWGYNDCIVRPDNAVWRAGLKGRRGEEGWRGHGGSGGSAPGNSVWMGGGSGGGVLWSQSIGQQWKCLACEANMQHWCRARPLTWVWSESRKGSTGGGDCNHGRWV